MTASPGLRLALAAAAAAVLGAAVAVLRSPALLEGWLFLFVLAAGLALGGLALLMIGHLLGEDWLRPFRAELESLARALPLVLIFALPLVFGLDRLYPWDDRPEAPAPQAIYLEPRFFLLRSAAYFAVWLALLAMVARPGRHRWASAVGLMLLGPTLGLAALDWVASREPYWISTLYGVASAASHLLAALSAAVLLTLWREGHPEAERRPSLQAAMLALALLTIWLWFSQFLIVWMGDLPDEARWYLARADGWLWLKLAVAVPALAAASVLLVPPTMSRARMLAAAALILLQHVAHAAWLVRPRLAVEPGWYVAPLLAALIAVWGIALAAELRAHPHREARQSPG